jgi:hypothetical protein
MFRRDWSVPGSIRKALGAALALVVVTVAWRSNYLAAMQGNPTAALQSVGLGVLCLWTASRLQMGLCLVAAVALRLLVPVEAPYYAGDVIAVLGLSGFCGFALLVYRAVATGDKKLFHIVLPSLIFLTLSVMLADLLRLAIKRTAHRYDLEIYAMDNATWNGFGPSFGRLIVSHAWAENVEELIYAALPGVMILVFAFYTYRRHNLAHNHAIDLLGLYLTMAISGFLLYFVVPACGPIYAFGRSFPFSLPPVQTAVLASDILHHAPNAMPSLHFANALMLYLNSKHWRGLHSFTFAFLILTGVATLGSGEHYVTDLVVAVPFAVALQLLFSSDRFAAAFPILLVSIWLLAITKVRVGDTPHWLLWTLTLGSLACPALLTKRSRLIRAPSPPQ